MPLKVHIKLDTGMTRTGMFVQHDVKEAVASIIRVSRMPHLDLEGLFTHFAAADMPEKDAYNEKRDPSLSNWKKADLFIWFSVHHLHPYSTTSPTPSLISIFVP